MAKKTASTKPRKARIPVDGSDARFRVEQDLRTIQNAAEIKSDTRRLAAAKALAKEQVASLTKVAKGMNT